MKSGMKKTPFAIVFFLMAAYSFSIELPDRSIYMEGTAEQEAHKDFFMVLFMKEAEAAGLTITSTREDAGFTFGFQVQSHISAYDPSIRYLVLLSLVENETDTEIVSFGWPFAELEDMYEHTHMLFSMAAAFIPAPPIAETEAEPAFAPLDTRWQNQRLYIRLSIDYPITFYEVQSTGLRRGAAYVPGPIVINTQHLDHIIMPRPGITVGVEWALHNFMSVEVNFQGNLGDPATYRFFNMTLGAQLKGILRTRNFMIQPYGAISVPLNVSPEFHEFPPFAAGGGAQVGIRGGRTAAIFLDVNVMMSIGDARRYNPFGTSFRPDFIHYRRFVVGLGIGYKFGFFERR